MQYRFVLPALAGFLGLSQTILAAVLNITHEDILLPIPGLRPDLRLFLDFNPSISLGDGPFGRRNLLSVSGGNFTATWGTGIVMPGGFATQTIIEADLSTNLDNEYLLKMDGTIPAYISIKTWGWRHGPREIMEKVFDPKQSSTITPFDYTLRMFTTLETGDGRLKYDLNYGMWIASGGRFGNTVIYDIYRIV